MSALVETRLVDPVACLPEASSQRNSDNDNSLANALKGTRHTTPSLCAIVENVRVGKIRPIGSTGIRSGIFKVPQEGAIYLGNVGLVGDEQQYAMHGGPDKALHQYCVDHYDTWRNEVPEKGNLFKAGAFGENIVTSGLHEGNICLGDIFRIGSQAVVQISEPRQPCYKLNHRFEWKHASRRIQETGRTGWYLRVLQNGLIEKGDSMVLENRIYPEWTIARIQRILASGLAETSDLEYLSTMPELGAEVRDLMSRRISDGIEDMSGRLQGDVNLTWQAYKVVELASETKRVKRIHLEKVDTEDSESLELPRFAHATLRFGPERCFNRTYSIVSGDVRSFELGVALDDKSRGGSRFLHEQLAVGSLIDVNVIKKRKNAAHPPDKSDRPIFIIGGIGITAFLSEMDQMSSRKIPFEVHYAVRSEPDIAYKSRLPSKEIKIYAKTRGQRLNVSDVIPARSKGKHQSSPRIYCCGPSSLMRSCQEETTRKGYTACDVHFELFGTSVQDLESQNEPFEVKIEGEEKTVQVGAKESMLKALHKAGFDVASSCLIGNCGMCMVDHCGGKVIHRGTALSEEEKEQSLLSCVSRGKSTIQIKI